MHSAFGDSQHDRNRDVHEAGFDAQARRHDRRDVQRGLREEPEGEHAQDHSEQKPVRPRGLGG